MGSGPTNNNDEPTGVPPPEAAKQTFTGLQDAASHEDFDEHELGDENTSQTEINEFENSHEYFESQEHEDLEEDLEDNYDVDAMYLVDASSIKQNQPITHKSIRYMPGNALKVEGVDYITVSEDKFYAYVQEGDQTADTLARYLNSLFRSN